MSAVVLHSAARPALRVRRRALRLILALALGLAATGVFLELVPVRFALPGDTVLLPVREVKVDGELRRADRARLREVVSAHLAGGLLQLDLARLRTELQRLPWVESAAVRRLLPDTVLVSVREHRPVARWNARQLLGRDGSVFEAGTARAEFADLPALAGPAGTQRDLHAMYATYAPRLAALGLQLTRVAMDARRSWRLSLAGGIAIELGRDDLEQRLQRFITLYRGPLHRDWEQVDNIDLRYTNGLAVRWRASRGSASTGSGDA